MHYFSRNFFIMFLFIPFYALAQIPKTISYQGLLTDSSGQAVPNNDYSITFKIYDASTGGTELWNEQQTVTVTNGNFNVILGSKNPLTLPFDKQYWLGITFNSEDLSPRIQLTSTGYSLNSLSVADSAITTNKIANGAVTQSKLSSDVVLPPGGNANGDLSGNYPNPTVVKIRGQNISSILPSNNQVLKWKDSSWIPSTDEVGILNGSAGGDLSGTFPNPTVAKIMGRNISTTAPTNDQVLKWNGSQWTPGNDEVGVLNGSAGGDLSGTYPNPTVAKIQGRNISTTAPTNNQVLKWNGTQWAPDSDLVGSVNGSAGGDLSGTYPDPTVAKIQGRNVSTTAPSSNQVLKWNGSQWMPSNDQTGGNGTVTQINTGSGLTGGPITTTGTINIATSGVTSSMILNGTITGSDISSSASLSTFSLNTSSYISSHNFLDYITSSVDGAGYVETKGTNGKINCRLSSLSGSANNGYMAVFDGSGTDQAGIYVNSSGQGIVYGDTKSFRIVNPLQAGTDIWYTCPEGPEAAVYIRGTAKLAKGIAVVNFPAHFSVVANSEGMTVQVTPLSASSLGLAVTEKSNQKIIVVELNNGKGSYDFDYTVMAVRKGHENYQVIRPVNKSMGVISAQPNEIKDR